MATTEQLTPVPVALSGARGGHGANRLGDNSLSDLIVFGRRAGAAVAGLAEGRTCGVATPAVAPSSTTRSLRSTARWSLDVVPGLFLRATELESHPLDTDDRRALVRRPLGLWLGLGLGLWLGLCNITKCCAEVCPEHLTITDNAVIPLKERVVDAAHDPVAWLGRRIRRRSRRAVLPLRTSTTDLGAAPPGPLGTAPRP